MNKKEVGKILNTISTMYQNKFKYDDPIALLEVWHDSLKDCEFDQIYENLKSYFKVNKFPPSVADLIKVEQRDIAVKNYVETLAMIEEWEKDKNNVADEKTRKEALAEIRETLGIRGNK